MRNEAKHNRDNDVAKNSAFIVIALGLFITSLFENDKKQTKQTKNEQNESVMARTVVEQCGRAGATKTGKKYNVIGSSINVRKGPGTNYERIINQQAKKTEYIMIDDSVTVFEECTKGVWSKICVVDPDWLRESHQGWVASKFLDKGKKKAKWKELLGNVWTGVKVYHGAGNSKSYAFEVLGGNEKCSTLPSGRGIYVRYEDGSTEWKDRKAMVNPALLFVLASDPALKRFEWRISRGC
ncbi:MAG: hypothetical protein ACE5FU_12035 [Nitrospinota bacterium]